MITRVAFWIVFIFFVDMIVIATVLQFYLPLPNLHHPFRAAAAKSLSE